MEETKTYINIDEARKALKDVGAPDEYIQLLDSLQTKAIKTLVKAEWIPFLDNGEMSPERYYRCTRCGRVERTKGLYCHCGALMQYYETKMEDAIDCHG